MADLTATGELGSLLREIAKQLGELDADSVMVGHGVDKFDDSWFQPLWQVALVGSAVKEDATEFRHEPQRPPITPVEEFERDCQGVRKAFRILPQLRKRDWLKLADIAFGKSANTMLFGRMRGQFWLARETPNVDDAGNFYAFCDDDRFEYFGDCIRIDQQFYPGHPFHFSFIRPKAFDHLCDAAHRWFVPEPQDDSAVEALESLLADASDRARRSISDTVVFVGQTSRDGLNGAFGMNRGDEGKTFTLLEPDAGEHSAETTKAREILEELERRDWRELFRRAFDPGDRHQPRLRLDISPTGTLLARDYSLFGLNEHGLYFAGVSGFMNLRDDLSPGYRNIATHWIWGAGPPTAP